MIIRKAAPNDLQDLDRIYRQSVIQLCGNDYSNDVIEIWQDSTPVNSRLPAIHKGLIYVSEIDDQVVGYMMAVPGEVIALFIDPAYAGKGVGRQLAEKALILAAQKETKEIRIESTLTAVPFYSKLGFSEVAQGFFTHGSDEIKIPVVHMIKSLT